MKKTLFFLLALFPFSAYSEVTTETLCFELSQSSPVKFEFRTFYDPISKWSGGFVKYAKSNVPISIVLTSSQDEILDPQAPWQHTTTWSEVMDGKVTGTYEWVTQGAQVVTMSYTKKSNGKAYSFMLNTSIDSSLETGCKWE
ncbi:hypothetical protein J3D54_001766 [Pseudomonas sp. GGS8]|uniref:hypothetical protein n=1 Tax=Pseudomonas sp. GGS8 TaxID=2817892 RepID=UPI00209DE925|nr:hypothetical protein [Pseudomonas sp. GGS8]MCP1442634.1 hypothetical protein [Pseudomonas sp. GGS8]